ncbi:MAG: hypothetical protein ACOYB3_00740 [Azonexus sp.]
MGEMTDTGDIAPVMTGSQVISNPGATGAKRRIPTATPDKTKKLRNRVVDGIMGRLREDRDGEVIPSDAKEVKSFDMNDHGLDLKQPEIPGQKIKNPYSGDEPLILPTASLVAPDVTPEAIHPLDPSQLPGADRGGKPTSTPAPSQYGGPGASHAPAQASPALDILMGKPVGQEPSAPTTPPMESALSSLPGIPSPAAVASPGGQVLMAANQPMPDHTPNDGCKTILEAFSRFVPRTAPKYD